MSETQIALMFKAFCDANRVRIMRMLTDGEKCAYELLQELSVSQPTLSHHMGILCDSGIVVARKQGKWMYYSISPRGAKDITECLNELVTDKSKE